MATEKTLSAKEGNLNEDEQLNRLIKKKEEEVKHLREKEESLCQKELLYQREKEVLLKQYKHVFPDQPEWRRPSERCKYEPKSSSDKRYKEVYELVCQIHQQEKQQEKLMLQVQEKKARKMLAEVDDVLKLEKRGDSNSGVETPLSKWYTEIRNSIKMDEGHHFQCASSAEKKQKALSITDKIFYHEKYQAKDDQSLPGKWCERLSFTTRHKGTCVNITIARKNSSSVCFGETPKNSDNVLKNAESYLFTTDPYVTNSQTKGMELLLRNYQPEQFVKEVVWNYIDEEMK